MALKGLKEGEEIWFGAFGRCKCWQGQTSLSLREKREKKGGKGAAKGNEIGFGEKRGKPFLLISLPAATSTKPQTLPE